MRDYREMHSKKMVLESLPESGKRREEMNERWPGSLFQTLEATDENDLDFAIPIFSIRNT